MKKFVSLSAALMLGTVLTKEKHSHVAKAIEKVEPNHKKEEARHINKKQSIHAIENIKI